MWIETVPRGQVRRWKDWHGMAGPLEKVQRGARKEAGCGYREVTESICAARQGTAGPGKMCAAGGYLWQGTGPP